MLGYRIALLSSKDARQVQYTRRSPNTIDCARPRGCAAHCSSRRPKGELKEATSLAASTLSNTVQGRNHKPATNGSSARLSHICNFPPQVMYILPVQYSTILYILLHCFSDTLRSAPIADHETRSCSFSNGVTTVHSKGAEH